MSFSLSPLFLPHPLNAHKSTKEERGKLDMNGILISFKNCYLLKYVETMTVAWMQKCSSLQYSINPQIDGCIPNVAIYKIVSRNVSPICQGTVTVNELLLRCDFVTLFKHTTYDQKIFEFIYYSQFIASGVVTSSVSFCLNKYNEKEGQMA
ncbi:hypothetical protein C0J52_25044 [Blattella germanica]|nr:hypothetical protein C0J52_25044 [Blattella germanica]